MSAHNSQSDQISPEAIIAHTEEILDTVRAKQLELEARIAETAELIDRTQRVLHESETVGGRSEEPVSVAQSRGDLPAHRHGASGDNGGVS